MLFRQEIFDEIISSCNNCFTDPSSVPLTKICFHAQCEGDIRATTSYYHPQNRTVVTEFDNKAAAPDGSNYKCTPLFSLASSCKSPNFVWTWRFALSSRSKFFWERCCTLQITLHSEWTLRGGETTAAGALFGWCSVAAQM